MTSRWRSAPTEIFLALRDEFVNDTGAYVRTHGSVVPGMTAGLLPGPYRWQAFGCDVRQVVTNKTPAGTYRAPGRYEANFARERIIDLAARRLGVDAVELRRRNLIAPEAMPYANGSHTDGHAVVYDSGDYPLLLEKGLERFDLPAMTRWRSEEPGPGRRRGIGTAMFIEKSGIGRWEYARVSLSAAGQPQVHCGSASLGQGVDTVLAQICAEHLGVSYDSVSVHHGDTSQVPDGMGSFGSRATMLAGSAVREAAICLRRRILELAADELEASVEDLEIVDDSVRIRGDRSVALSLPQLARLGRPAESLDRGRLPHLSDEAYFGAEQMSFPYGLHCAAVEVDLETGGVEVSRYMIAYDVGVAVNPQLVEGQIVGGAAQGLGGALLEELAYDPAGQLVSGSFMDYLLPTAAEVPRVDVLITEDAPTPLNPLGVKGAGEGGTAAAGAVIANAVSDALDTEVLRLPLSPQAVLELADAGSAGMKPAAFEYDRPDSVEHALALLAEHADDVKVLAGGQSLMPMLNFRLARPGRLVDINGLGALASVRRADGVLHVGALTRQAMLERSDTVRTHWPLLHEALSFVAHPQIRNRGTIGGSVAHADPAAELPVALTALDASVTVASRRGSRSIAIRDLYVTHLTTCLEADELLTEIIVPPVSPAAGSAFVEYARRHGDFGLGGAAVVLTPGSDGRCERASIVLLGRGADAAARARGRACPGVADDRRGSRVARPRPAPCGRSRPPATSTETRATAAG